MSQTLDFRTYVETYFARLCRGYVLSLDDTQIRAWLPGHKNASDDGGAWDLSTRIFPAMCAWLSKPKRAKVLRIKGSEIDVEALALAILERAFDPEQPGFWGKDEFPPRNQRTVESSILAYGAWLVAESLLPKISERAETCFRDWLDYFASDGLVKGNWNLFWTINHTARKRMGWTYDQGVIDESLNRIAELHRGDGWMTDGPEGYFDDYNWWVFGTHELFWMQMDGDYDPDRRDCHAGWIRRRMEDYPYFFAADGSYCEYGRSLSYKFARLGAPLLAYKLGLWPHGPGLLKRIVRRHLAWYDRVGALSRPDDTVRQTLSEFGHPAVRDSYINTGHPYWCMNAFTALWQVPDDDPFWACDEDPLPVERNGYARTIRPAGWIVQGLKAGGHVLRHQLGTQHGAGSYGAKYGKFLYGSHFPVNFGSVAGDFGPDAALCLSDGSLWAHPGRYDACIAGEGYLRARYTLTAGEGRVDIDTTLLPHEEGCLRLHALKVHPARRKLTLVEGSSALGYAPGDAPAKKVGDETPSSLASLGSKVSWIASVEGYAEAHPASGFRGNEHLNGVYDRAITPTLSWTTPASDKPTEHRLICWTLTSLKGAPDPLQPPKVSIEARNGGWKATLGDRTVDVPALPDTSKKD